MHVSERLIELSSFGQMAIYTDIDGTLSLIAPSPSEATAFPGAADALRAIRDHGVRVVAISGRSADDARQLLGIEGIDYAGNHGFELLTPAGRIVSPEVEEAAKSVQAAMAETETNRSKFPDGVVIENKTYTGSVHFRLTDDPLECGPVVRSLVEAIGDRHGLRITDGRMVFELRPKLEINKGVFVAADVRRYSIRAAAFLGDDLTDVDGFRAIHDLIETGELLAGAAIGVVSPESPPEVIAHSDLTISGVAGLVEELRMFAQQLAERET